MDDHKIMPQQPNQLGNKLTSSDHLMSFLDEQNQWLTNTMDPNQSNTLNQNGDLNGNPYLFTYIPTNSSLQTMPANYSNMDSSLPQQQQHQPQILTQPIQIQAPTQNQMHNFNQNGTIQQQQPIIIQHQPQQPSPPQTIPSIPNTSSSIVPPSSYSISPSSNTSSARSSPHSVDSPFRITVQPVGWQVAKYHVHPHPEITFNGPVDEATTVRCCLVYQGFEVNGAFEKGDFVTLKPGTVKHTFKELVLHKMGPIKEAGNNIFGKGDIKTCVRFIVSNGQFKDASQDSNEFFIVSSTSRIPADVRDTVRPRMKGEKADFKSERDTDWQGPSTSVSSVSNQPQPQISNDGDGGKKNTKKRKGAPPESSAPSTIISQQQQPVTVLPTQQQQSTNNIFQPINANQPNVTVIPNPHAPPGTSLTAKTSTVNIPVVEQLASMNIPLSFPPTQSIHTPEVTMIPFSATPMNNAGFHANIRIRLLGKQKDENVGFVKIFGDTSLAEVRANLEQFEHFGSPFLFWHKTMKTIIDRTQESSVQATEAVDWDNDQTLDLLFSPPNCEMEIQRFWAQNGYGPWPVLKLTQTLISTYGGVENFLSPSQIPEDELTKRTTIVRQGICHFLLNTCTIKPEEKFDENELMQHPILFEDFILFVKFFGPLPRNLFHVFDVYSLPYFHGFIADSVAQQILASEPGGFLFRYSESRLKDGCFAFAVGKVVSYNNQANVKVQNYALPYFKDTEEFVFGQKRYRCIHHFVSDPTHSNIFIKPIPWDSKSDRFKLFRTKYDTPEDFAL